MEYIEYDKLEEFYLVPEVCQLFGMDLASLKRKAEEYKVNPSRNENGEPGFIKHDVRRLHNKLYWEERTRVDPWEAIKV